MIYKTRIVYEAQVENRRLNDHPTQRGGGTKQGNCTSDGRILIVGRPLGNMGRNQESSWKLGSCSLMGIGLGDWE